MPLPFAVQASTGCPTHAELALALAGEFGDVDAGAVDGALDALAAELGCARTQPPVEQLAALGSLLDAFAAVEAQADPRVLMLDAALERFEGHPALLAVVACEAGRRAGFELGVIGDGGRHLVAHRGLDRPLALDTSQRGRTRGGEQLEGLTWRCSHQLSFTLLRELVDCSLRGGDLDRAIRAANLRLTLPVGRETLDVLRAELAALRARLN